MRTQAKVQGRNEETTKNYPISKSSIITYERTPNWIWSSFYYLILLLMNTKYIITYLIIMSGITLYYLSVYFWFIGQAKADYWYECMNAYNLQYQLDELADKKHNAQMMLLMPELTGMQRATLKVTIRNVDKEMNRLEPMFTNWFLLCNKSI